VITNEVIKTAHNHVFIAHEVHKCLGCLYVGVLLIRIQILRLNLVLEIFMACCNRYSHRWPP
jgi:hypothetical protein